MLDEESHKTKLGDEPGRGVWAGQNQGSLYADLPLALMVKAFPVLFLSEVKAWVRLDI